MSQQLRGLGFYPHFIEEEIYAQTCDMTFPRSHKEWNNYFKPWLHPVLFPQCHASSLESYKLQYEKVKNFLNAVRLGSS